MFTIVAVLFGAAMGSFAGAQVWRLRAQQLAADKASGEKVDKKEFSRLQSLLGRKLKDDRSQCLSCGYRLRWYDMLPIVSWLTLRGKCRQCKQRIGWAELLLEVSLAALFGLSVALWPGSLTDPLEVAKLATWLVALVALAINFVYDARWSLLDARLNWLLIGCGAVYGAISVIQAPDMVSALILLVGSVAVLGGLYGILHLVSGGRWVGNGDIYLGAGLGLFLLDWKVAIVALFAANLIGTLVIAPGLASGALKRGSQVPFGPFLIAGGLVAWFVGAAVVDWYMSLLMFV